ncbi:hypothetical protein QFZ35_001918 [Arthrobacter ulcerisalmonis]|uniref:hypothetical protein n=1 Tax=Arthrobacter sp. B1I2 TaxID=3042263 RepID=UPI0027830796|nr:MULTISPECIES: hypothetical protein [Arthrobacter]MDQ0663420.1 hypothetical protein [Arthrobacter ulcerisalmonis]MDQ0731310.1 hypothetical protein [Arthrobacter sp. B1I2]
MTEVKDAEDYSLGFGIADMAYLLQLQKTPGSLTSAERLRLLDESRDAGLVRAGLSSLIARGLAKVASDAVVTFDSRVDVVAYTLAHAVQWTQLDLLKSSELGDTVLHFESDKTRLLFQPRTMLTWFAVPQDSGVTAENAETYLISEHLREHPNGGVRIRTEGPAGSAELVVKRDNEHWVWATVAEGVVGDQTAAEDETALLHVLKEVRATARRDGDGE